MKGDNSVTFVIFRKTDGVIVETQTYFTFIVLSFTLSTGGQRA